MGRFQLAIFDLDGTLLDSLADLAHSANEMLAENGYPVHPVDHYRHFVGDGARTLVERILPPEIRSPEVISGCLRRYGEIYAGRWDEQSRPYEGIPELLGELVSRGLRMAVLSNKPEAATLRCVGRFFGDQPWAKVIGQREGRLKKPAPDGVFEILGSLGVGPVETLYLGDTDTDMKTAAAAGVYPVGVLWGFRDQAELVTNGAKLLLGHPAELLSLVDGS